MKKFNILALSLALSPLCGQKNFWSKTSETKVSQRKDLLKSAKTKYEHVDYYQLDLDALKKELSLAPLRHTAGRPVKITLPNKDGGFDAYEVWESPVMEPELAAKFPEIKNYLARKSDNTLMQFGLSSSGIRFTDFSHGPAHTLESISQDAKVYKLAPELVNRERSFNCSSKRNSISTPSIAPSNKTNTQKRSNDSRYRQFRFALLPTYEFNMAILADAGITSTASTAVKKAKIIEYLAATVRSMNVVYERDLGVHLNLIANNDELIQLTETSFTSTSSDDLGTNGNAYIINTIGSNAFDLGHVMHYEDGITPGGSAATTDCSSSKADAGTVSDAIKGARLDIDYVAHEVGHQIGANHTMASSCATGLDATIEPGSGLTVMAYAGVGGCGDHAQLFSEPFLHSYSIDEIQTKLLSMTCFSSNTASNNPAPTANAGLDYTIPKSTAFKLTGSATDSNNPNSLTYTWEQIDKAGRSTMPVSNQTGGPLYRYRAPSTSPTRYFPPFTSVIAGNLTPNWEVTPSVARNLNFNFLVRDNHTVNGGQTRKDTMKLTVANVGPFKVTSQAATGITYNGNSTQTITWDVAGTTANNINTANVKISLSTDGGLTFPNVLAASTPNDGSQLVTMPNNISTTKARIMIEAVGNVFYAVNSTAFAIQKTLGLDEINYQDFKLSPNPSNGEFSLTYNTKSSQDTLVEITNLLGQNVYRNSFKNESELKTDIKLNVAPGTYIINITDGENIMSKKLIIK